MHCDIHALGARYRATELHSWAARRDAAAVARSAGPDGRGHPPADPVLAGIRHRVGWTLVSAGLRLVAAGPSPADARR
ncbi:hypothetical protein QNO07_17810 [Streptomyces sp. 549]|uniref:hypothetical protein n=1 Tax=Streptomyces sp. 549 TaxID=3049076 RepID=UPI0024C43373|nr:hypothetical protein [Streptomyces sp. 549]MDK1475251.1 hypothetical protein [Streptomyces sp. 549]